MKGVAARNVRRGRFAPAGDAAVGNASKRKGPSRPKAGRTRDQRKEAQAETTVVAAAGPVIQPVIQIGEHEATDMMTYLLQNRILFVSGYLNDDATTQIVGSLMALEQTDSTQEIKLYMNSPGGSIYNVAGIIDVMNTMKSPISTIAFGSVAHNSTLVLAAGDKGKRYSMPNARIMMVQPMGGAMGSFVEVNITAAELNRQMKFSNELFSKYTGKTVEEIEMETDREKFLGPEQALELGLIDGIIGETSGVSKMVEETMADFKKNSAWRGAGTM
ncbi:proteolytic subunit of ATP-dependent Clp protease [Chloropicon primus]|uniref:ATP-dependent Clp protease proteolytic subunit n=1 Tax=Chloropicon primus TaxID=1764295 RepID=A0A5B8MB74_9CHLO|nr:proteolytic subunit of ATP-dependent Clp protease [Chloropicon primus]UPQ96801.1 proteolytic subunit of ATP-dependent Clp protease [Chloropicon primus]|eukprot:QDZ17583.1 proteolytic subunit of ATP-dependent Clp protease [Chloropicon primus]